MKYIIPHPLSGAKTLKEPLVQPGVSWEIYLSILGAEAIKHHRQFGLAVEQLSKWVQEDYDLSVPAAINEEYLEILRARLKQGEKLGLRGKPLTRSTVRKTFTDIRLLHNWVQAADQKPRKLLRPLADGRLISRFMFFNSLTEQTQKAIITFEQSATKLPYDRQLMTGQTRKGAIDSALLVLRRLEVEGLEQITPAHINALTADPDANNPEYRQISRSLHNASCLFRFCVRKGLLPDNPLTKVDNSSFANYAIRDFLPPDQLETLLDIHGTKGGTKVDLNDELSVRDRLIALMLVDLALRRSELASLSWGNVQHNREGDGCQIRLAPENQKMATKTAAVLPILYPATQELLERYAQIKGVKIGQRSDTPLIIDKRRRLASSGTIGSIVRQLAQKLGLRTYHQSVPSCHDLRRTFATCNVKPLGLELDLQELSERLRAGINVVHQHYILQNPLLQEAKAKKYRDKLVPKDVDEESLEMVEKLESLDPSNRDMLKQFRDAVARRVSAKQEARTMGHIPSWIDESEAMSILHHSWNNVPRIRCLREYFASRNASKRSGSHGVIYYDAVEVKELASRYEPISDHIENITRPIRSIATGFDLIPLGRVKLIRREQTGTFLKSTREVGKKLSLTKTGKTGLSKSAKQNHEKQAWKSEPYAKAL